MELFDISLMIIIDSKCQQIQWPHSILILDIQHVIDELRARWRKQLL